jgi:hypothetical protein
MLITRKPHKLERFWNVKPFDLFLCVTDQDGSNFLKRLENPTHDNFEFTRIKLEADRKKARKKYQMFTDRIRELVTQYAELPTDGPDEVDDLGFLFSDVFDSEASTIKKLNVADSCRYEMVLTRSPTENVLLAHRGSPQLEVGWVPACRGAKERRRSLVGTMKTLLAALKFPALVTKTTA